MGNETPNAALNLKPEPVHINEMCGFSSIILFFARHKFADILSYVENFNAAKGKICRKDVRCALCEQALIYFEIFRADTWGHTFFGLFIDETPESIINVLQTFEGDFTNAIFAMSSQILEMNLFVFYGILRSERIFGIVRKYKMNLPEISRFIFGKKVKSAEEFERFRRDEILGLFEKHIYGRRPYERPEDLSFCVNC